MPQTCVGLPAPMVPKDALLGLALSQASSSFIFFAGRIFFPNEHQRIGCQGSDWLEIHHHVVLRAVNSPAEDVRVHLADAERIAVRGGARDSANPKASARAGHVLDNDWLSERRTHSLGQNARNRIRSLGW